ncbi:MAG TPA: polysaccharide deacetylase family protein [Pseudonocardiaceae bacterium]|jgi:peptidoglycan/xylan/chitin deacetylase (PgdA/CDA1 family)|nr:polysaccharide deacetylase family protein [Pseudonocardiaceae bacterium]
MTGSSSTVVVTTSWDDGHELDSRLATLLHDNAIPATFYVATRNVEMDPARRLTPSALRELGEDFEIGGHTLHHLPLTSLADDDAREEMRAGRAELEDITGRQVTSFCYPMGAYRPVHTQLAGEVGFTVARTVRRGRLAMNTALEMATTVNAYAHLVDGPQALRLAVGNPVKAARYFRNWDELAMCWFDRCLARGGVYHLWGHSWEVDERGDWDRLARVLRYISARPGVRYASNGRVPELMGVA